MNRFEKEQLRKYLHENISKLSDLEQRQFFALFASEPNLSSSYVINQIKNKQLRRAYKYVHDLLKL